jgi:hypothetical protein
VIRLQQWSHVLVQNHYQDKAQVTPKQARAALWSRGVVAPWYLRRSQLDIYELLLQEKFPFIEAGRRFGKTNTILAFVIEKLIQNPGWICRWCFPEKNLAMEVLGEEIPKLQRDIPEQFQFKFQTKHSVWVHPNGSKIYCRGVNEDKGRSARGPASNIIVCDEYGFWNDPRYIVRDALFPQLEKQAGQWLIRCSTPPPNLGHAYYEEWEEFSRKNRRITKTILDNESLSPQEIETVAEECGGKESTSWLRERMCKHIKDPKLIIVREYDDGLNVVPNNFPRPEFFTTYTSGDSGADDNTAVLFAYYDFLKAAIVVEDEIVLNGITTSKVVDLAKIKEMMLWGGRELAGAPLEDLWEKVWGDTAEEQEFRLLEELHAVFKHKPHTRSWDASKQQIFDLFSDYKYPVRMAIKAEKLAAIHEFRVEVGQESSL